MAAGAGHTHVRPESLRGQQSALAAHLNVGSTGIRVTDSKSAADPQQLATLRAGGRLNAVGGHAPDWTEKWSNPRAIQLMNSFRPQTTTGALVRTDAAAQKALSESGRSEAKTGGVVYRDALRWYKPPPGQPEYLPKKLRLAPTARPKSVPAVTQRELETGVFTEHFPPPPPIERRRFPDLNYPFTPVETPPTAKYTTVHSAMQHGVNNAIPNPLATMKNASRDAYFKSSSIAHNAAIAKADGTIALMADEEKRSGRAAAAAGAGAGGLAPVVTRLASPKGAAPAAASPSARVGSPDAKQQQLSASASSGELSATTASVGAVPTRVNHKRRSFVARQFFHQEGVFESAGGVTHAYRYFMAGSRPFGGAPRMWQPSKTTETGYRYDCYTKY